MFPGLRVLCLEASRSPGARLVLAGEQSTDLRRWSRRVETMTAIGLFDGTRHVGSAAIPPGQEMPEAVIRGDEVFLYFQGDQLDPRQRPSEGRLELRPDESARFLKVSSVLRVDP
jgi:hypothetical protein